MADRTAAKGFVMTPEDEEFNRVEMESRIKQEYVRSMLAQPEPPPECQTEPDKMAFAYGWFKTLALQREKNK